VTADFLVVLDACVLLPAPLRDTLLRLAEEPRLFVPRWSDEIMAETSRNLECRVGLSPQKTAYLVTQLRTHFADAWVTGYEPLIDRMTNHPKDRHVLAAAVRCGASVIVTYNKRDFPASATEPWGVDVLGPGTFLKYQYDLNPPVVIEKLYEQARDLGRTLSAQLAVLRKAVPSFVDAVCQDLNDSSIQL
jgi:predicted nucleic acid-binding protein